MIWAVVCWGGRGPVSYKVARRPELQGGRPANRTGKVATVTVAAEEQAFIMHCPVYVSTEEYGTKRADRAGGVPNVKLVVRGAQ